jgi:hypothetical protein
MHSENRIDGLYNLCIHTKQNRPVNFDRAIAIQCELLNHQPRPKFIPVYQIYAALDRSL